MSRLDHRSVLLFISLAFALAWLACLPLWLGGKGLADPRAAYLLPVMMVTPALTTLLMALLFRRRSESFHSLGLSLGRGGWWRYWLFGWLAIPLFTVGALPLGHLFGVYAFDAELSGFRAALEASPQGAEALETVSPAALLALRILQTVLLAPLLNGLFTLGEELGWRGYLLPKLLPLGQWRALILSGVIWGLWHAPIILLGYNYPENPRIGLVLMTIMCVILGVLLGWTRLATDSVWPAVIAHGALNGTAGFIALFAERGSEIDPAQAGITGWTGWILPCLWIAGLVATRRLPAPQAREA